MFLQTIKIKSFFGIIILLIQTGILAFSTPKLAFAEKPYEKILNDQKKDLEKIEPMNQVYIFAFSQLTDMLENDLADLEIRSSALMAIYSQSPILSPQFEDYAIFNVMNAFKDSLMNPVRCIECLTTNAKIIDDEFVISRGFSSDKDLEVILKKFKLSNYVATSVTVTETQLILGVTIHDFETKKTLFQKEYRTPIYEIDRKGLQFFIGAGILKFPDLAVTGGFVGFGQYFLGNGTTGLSVSMYGDKSSEEGQLYFLKYFIDLDINHIFENYWLWGGLFFSLEGGIISTKNSLQGFAGPSIKIALGKSFFFQGGGYGSQILGKNSGKKTTSEQSTTKTILLDTREKLPNSIFGAIGIRF